MSVLSSLTEYTLPNVNSPAGEFTIKLYSAINDLTVPTKQTILSIGDNSETADIAPSVQEASTLTIEIADDTSVYPGGFWYNVMSDEAHLKIMLLENTAETYFFFGTIEPLESETTDLYIDSTDSVFVRSSSILLTSFEKKIFDILTDDVMADVYGRRMLNTTDTPTPNQPYYVCRLIHIFASILYVGNLNDSYSVDDVSFVYDVSNPDFKYIVGASEYTFDQLFMYASLYTNNPTYSDNQFPNPLMHGGHVGALSPGAFSNSFYRIKDFVKGILETFQLLLRFDFSDSRVKIKLYQRGRAFQNSENISNAGKISRTIRIASDKRIASAKATDQYVFSERWVSNVRGDSVQSGAIPDYISIDSTIITLLKAGPTAISNEYGLEAAQSIWGSAAADGESFDFVFLNKVSNVKYYSYRTTAYITTSLGELGCIVEAVCGYVYDRFSMNKKEITVEYGGLKSNNGSINSQALSRSLMRTAINDGISSSQYYAQSVTKNPSTNRMTIVWIEE